MWRERVAVVSPGRRQWDCSHHGRIVTPVTAAPHSDPAFAELSDAVLAIAAERSLEPILQRMVATARELARARYAALGIPDGAGGFVRFITSGLTDEEISRIGPLPRTHGLLGAMLESSDPVRTPDIKTDPRYRWWPAAHPDMGSFLGVPVVSKERVIAAFYLTDREGQDEFSAADQEAIEVLAAHAAVAIENARSYDLARELSVIEERNRLARELHDSVTQRLFSLELAAETATTLLDRDLDAARLQLARVQEMAREAMAELRAVIFELRPATVEDEGLLVALRKHVDVLRRVEQRPISFAADGGVPPVGAGAEAETFRIAQEALNNALRHSGAERIWVRLGGREGRLTLEVGDDGTGFDPAAPALRARRLGLTSMEERAAALGGSLVVDSTPGDGTRVRLEL
jgi:signal transduction histidine kinase